MKLSDFTLSDITKFLGNKVCPSDASNDHQAVPETTEVAAQQQGFNGETSPHIQAATSNTISSSAAKNNLPSLRGTSAETQEASGRKPNHSSDAARVSTGRDLTDESHTKIPTLNSTTSDNVTSQQHVEFDLSSSGSPSQSVKRIDFDQRKISDADTLSGGQSARNIPLLTDHFRQLASSNNPFNNNPNNSNKPNESPVHSVRRFFDLLSTHLPTATSALDAILSSRHLAALAAGGGATDSEQRLAELTDTLVDYEVKESRLQAEILKLSQEVSQATALNNSLNRQYQSMHEDLLVAQSSAQRYKEDATRLVRDTAVLREEVMLLRTRNSLLENEFRGTDRILPSDVPLMTSLSNRAGSPSNQAAANPSGSRRPLHHVKSSSNGNGGGAASALRPNINLETDGLKPTNVLNSPTAMMNKWANQQQQQQQQPSGIRPATAATPTLYPSRQFIVTQVYKPAENAALEQFACLTEGEIVSVDREDDSGWWWVTNGRPAGSGWYPFSFLRPVPQQ